MFRKNYMDRLKAMKNGGSTQEYMFLRSGFIENLGKSNIEKAAKLLIIIYFMPFGKELWKNGLFE